MVAGEDGPHATSAGIARAYGRPSTKRMTSMIKTIASALVAASLEPARKHDANPGLTLEQVIDIEAFH